ncbi:MAG: nucleotidyl transferase AbiEii/AbiGii toxin family protein [Burkholderiales bacterium]
MSSRVKKNVAASVRERLLNIAKGNGEPFDLVLVRYALERFLYRIGISPFADRFMLKGALLYLVWGEDAYRPTRDGDLLASGSSDLRDMEKTFRQVCGVAFGDGIVFQADSVRAQEIAEEAAYSGIRVNFVARLDSAIIPVQFDIGFGDAVTPGPERIQYPVLLDFPAPELRAYPIFTVVAEKFHAIVVLGMQNSRMKDFYDLWAMSRRFEFDSAVLSDAISATFARRKTPLPEGVPIALSAEFSDSPAKGTQWKAFSRRNQLTGAELTLGDVLTAIRGFVMPVVGALRRGDKLAGAWMPGGPWSKNK